MSQPSCSHSKTISEIQLQKTIVLRMQPRHEATLTQPFTLRERSYSCKAQWNSIGNSSTSTTCNPIYIAGTILQLQITMEFCRPQMRETQVTPHLQCGTDPRMIRPWSETDPTTHETVSQPSHRRGTSSRFGDGLCIEKHRVSCICYLSKTHFVRDFLQNSIGNSSTSTTCNPIYSEGTILELQITMEFHRQLIHQHHLQSHLNCGNDPTVANHNGILSTTCAKHRWHPIYNAEPEPIRDQSAHDPPMIRPHTRPSRNRRTAEVDHRGSGTDFVWKNTGFRASAISQKRISCETSFKTPSATSTTCNPIYSEGTILELQITMEFHRQLIHQHHLQSHLHCGNDPTVANHNGILSTTCAKHRWHPIYNAEPIREWSDHDPRPIRPHTRPSRNRRTAEVHHRGSGTDFV